MEPNNRISRQPRLRRRPTNRQGNQSSTTAEETSEDDKSPVPDDVHDAVTDPVGICVEEHGSERGSDRFPRGGDATAPRIATWRNNLTALSQYRNLYFVGCAHQVFVYQPAGYAQTIGSAPALILTPTMKNPNAVGYISMHAPHAMNSMIVGDLGQEEILLLATDSGNVAAYRTEHVLDAIQDKTRNNTQNPEVAGRHVECFFSDWVGQSAWGLAIHKFARLIAVSSNTSYITVYAFALVEPSANSDSDEATSFTRLERDSQSEWLSITGRMQYSELRRWSPQRRRARNLRLTLYGHTANIPNVSFLNSDLDPEGNWLFSTDIDNELLAWRLWDRPKPVHAWSFYPSSMRRQHFLDDRQRGWNVLPVDPRVFRVKSSVKLACGGPVRLAAAGDICDLTFLGGCVPDSNRYYRFFPPPRMPEEPDIYPFDVGGPPSDESFSGSFASSRSESETDEETSNFDPAPDEGHDEQEEPTTSRRSRSSHLNSDANNSPAADPTSSQSIAHLMQLQSSVPLGPNHPIWGIIRDQQEEARHREESAPPPVEPMSEPQDLSELSDDDMSETDPDRTLATLFMGQSASHRDQRDTIDESSSSASEDEGEPVDRPEVFSQFPILHFSEAHIRLIASPSSLGQSVLFRAPLYQAFRQSVPSLENCDRFNMVHQIPELGVVVAASQKGRVAIISLTEVQGEGRYFRVDKIAPFGSQEKFGLRPLCPLLGIAVGPVESHLLPVENPDSSSDEEEDDEEKSEHTLRSATYLDATTSTPSSTQGNDVEQPQTSHPASQGESASQAGQPAPSPPRTPKRQTWHGSEYTRRYRLFLMYCDHTVMHYELYYDWPRDIRGTEGQFLHDASQPFSIRP